MSRARNFLHYKSLKLRHKIALKNGKIALKIAKKCEKLQKLHQKSLKLRHKIALKNGKIALKIAKKCEKLQKLHQKIENLH